MRTHSSSSLKIESVETRLVSVPFDGAFGAGTYTLRSQTCLFVRVDAGELVGEAYVAVQDGVKGGTEVARFLTEDLAPAILGQPLDSADRLWQRLVAVVRRNSSAHDWAMRAALGLVDAAIWDALGKSWQIPAWRLWGGYSPTAEVMWTGGYYGSDIADEIAAVNESGSAALKFKVGGRAPEDDAARLMKAHGLLDSQIVLTADANCAWSMSEATQFLSHVDVARLDWFEEPSRRENGQREWRDIRLGSGISVAGGQTEWSATQCLDLMSYGSIDVCNFDALWGGGPTEWRRVAGIAEALGVDMAHHQQVTVGAHLVASVANGRYAEIYSPERDPIWWQGIANRPDIVDGGIRLPDGGGLGWEYDWEWLGHHVVESGSALVGAR